MKPFKFRLASVLRVARLHEEADKRALAAEQRRLADAEREERERRAALDGHPVLEPGTVDALDAQRFVLDLRARAVQEAEGTTRVAAGEVAVALERWQRAARRVKSLEQLEERKRVEHALVAARAAQRALDDLARARRSS